MKRLLPGPVALPLRERARVVLGAALGLLLTGLLSQLVAGDGATRAALVAPMGASAVLLFAVATGPMSQPWPVVVGNTVSALAGVACVRLVQQPLAAAVLAVGLAMALMLLLRALHPPGGAMALSAALTQQTDFAFVLYPVAFDSILLVLAAWAYHGLCGRPYLPQLAPPRAAGTPPESPATAPAFTAEDIDAALAAHPQLLDVGAEDLQALLGRAQAHAYGRRMAELLCRDVMSAPVVSVQFGDTLEHAWDLMRQKGIKALPVVDRANRIAGIITQADFLRHAQLDEPHGLAQRLRELVRPSGKIESDRPEVVGQIMARRVRVASSDRPLAELLPLFSEHGHHHIPIVDAQQRLVGVITQTDVVRVLVQGGVSRR